MNKENEMDEKIHDEITQLARTVDSVLVEVKLTKEVSVENRRTLRGHNGSEGVVTMVSSICKDIDTIRKDVESIVASQERTDDIVFGKDGSPGLSHRVNDIEKLLGAFKKVAWFVLFGILGDIILRVWPELVKLFARL